jgi:hypothetical protein
VLRHQRSARLPLYLLRFVLRNAEFQQIAFLFCLTWNSYATYITAHAILLVQSGLVSLTRLTDPPELLVGLPDNGR